MVYCMDLSIHPWFIGWTYIYIHGLLHGPIYTSMVYCMDLYIHPWFIIAWTYIYIHGLLHGPIYSSMVYCMDLYIHPWFIAWTYIFIHGLLYGPIYSSMVYCMDLYIHPWFIAWTYIYIHGLLPHGTRCVVRLPLSGTLGESVERSENTPCGKPSNALPTMVTALMPAFAPAERFSGDKFKLCRLCKRSFG